jgi:hypothetical protein
LVRLIEGETKKNIGLNFFVTSNWFLMGSFKRLVVDIKNLYSLFNFPLSEFISNDRRNIF